MAKFNLKRTRAATASPVTTEATPSGRTHEGAPGYARDAKSELFLFAVSNMVGEASFYETGGERDERFRRLVHAVAVTDPDWMVGMIGWLRGEANMRSASLVAAAETARARLDAGLSGHSRQAVDAALARADEPGEMLAYWTSRYGRAIPKPVKRGVADAVRRLYDERALCKYDTASRGFRFADVLELVHPSPRADWQGDLFGHALDRRHDRADGVPDSLVMVRRNGLVRSEFAPADWLNPDALREAGMTWEDALSAVGSVVEKSRLWEALIPSMGYTALLRNLRNFDQAGVSDEVAAQVAARLADPEQVARSRQLPMRFLSAHRAALSLRWAYPLERALGHCLANVPELPGRTLVLVDRSGSMFFGNLSDRSELTWADAAAIFGSALALRCAAADLVQFGTDSRPVAFDRGESVLRVIDRFDDLGGTNTADAVRRHYRRHDRIVVVTDEQAHRNRTEVTRAVPDDVPVYTWNLAGYRDGHAPGGLGTRHTFGGLSDAAFRMIPLIEAGRNADWPWRR